MLHFHQAYYNTWYGMVVMAVENVEPPFDQVDVHFLDTLVIKSFLHPIAIIYLFLYVLEAYFSQIRLVRVYK